MNYSSSITSVQVSAPSQDQDPDILCFTIEQNGGASDLLLESLNPRGCAERTSELRL